MEDQSTIDIFCSNIYRWIGENGVYPTPGLVRTDTGIELFSFMVNAPDIVRTAMEKCLLPNTQEIIIGLDTWTKPDQGTELDSCLIIFHITRSAPTRIGVYEYSWGNGSPVIKNHVNWDNEFWNARYRDLAEKFTNRINPLIAQGVKRP
jgi:hypothetical protein